MSKSESRERQQQCEEILLAIVRSCDKGPKNKPAITFYPDWGFPSVTIAFPMGHTHVGIDGQDWGSFVEELHRLLVEGAGLSLGPKLMDSTRPCDPKPGDKCPGRTLDPSAG
jgi:hypothetical protein